MERKRLCQSVAWLAVGVSAAWLVSSAAAQETLGRNKSPAQTFASDCAVCHKSPQGLAKSGGRAFWGGKLLARALHVEQGVGRSACELSASRGQRTRRAPSAPPKAISQNPANRKRRLQSRPRPRAADGKPSGAAGDAKPSDGRPADIMAPERRAVEPRSNPPAAGEAKPAEGAGE